MTPRVKLAGLVAVVLGGCTASHLGDACDRDSDCALPLACDIDPGSVAPRTCVSTCDRAVDGAVCDGGAACLGMRCAAGGTVPEGGIAAAPRVNDCAFGLVGAYDYSAEPILLRCRRVCEWEGDDCRADEGCDSAHVCVQRCAAVDGSPFGIPCDPPAVCSWGGTTCVSPRRVARADCDGDGDLEFGTGDCEPGFQCDPEAIGGCGFVPEGEL